MALLNGAIKVELDTDARTIQASTAEGDRWDGQANHFESGYTKRQHYFLPTGFTNGVELELYKDGQHKLCVAPDRCTVCAQE